jgi:hypothetical protein
LEVAAGTDMGGIVSRPSLPDLKYFSLIYGRKIDKERLLKTRSPCLNEVVATFYNNLVRTDTFSVFPAAIAFEAIRDQLWRDCAVFKVMGKVAIRGQELSAKQKKAIEKELRKLVSAEHKQQAFAGPSGIQTRIKIGANHVEGMASYELGSSDGIKALLFAVIVESWMAFEILVADLFYEALDHGPSEWRINVGRKHKEFSGGSNWEPQKVAPPVVHDPQENYGSFLKDNDAISFQKFRAIKFWYKTAFGEKAEKLFRDIEGGYIRALSAVRNVILHKGGIADATYKKEIQKFPELNSAEEKKLIRLDGEIVRKLRNAAIALGVELILYIDSVLVPPAGAPKN